MSIIISFVITNSITHAEDNIEYKFDESEFERKLFTFGGYAELSSSLYIPNRNAALYRLKYYNNDPGNPYADAFLSILPEATFEKGIFRAFVRAFGTAGYTDND
jgi:hypothetical protein